MQPCSIMWLIGIMLTAVLADVAVNPPVITTVSELTNLDISPQAMTYSKGHHTHFINRTMYATVNKDSFELYTLSGTTWAMKYALQPPPYKVEFMPNSFVLINELVFVGSTLDNSVHIYKLPVGSTNPLLHAQIHNPHETPCQFGSGLAALNRPPTAAAPGAYPPSRITLAVGAVFLAYVAPPTPADGPDHRAWFTTEPLEPRPPPPPIPAGEESNATWTFSGFSIFLMFMGMSPHGGIYIYDIDTSILAAAPSIAAPVLHVLDTFGNNDDDDDDDDSSIFGRSRRAVAGAVGHSAGTTGTSSPRDNRPHETAATVAFIDALPSSASHIHTVATIALDRYIREAGTGARVETGGGGRKMKAKETDRAGARGLGTSAKQLSLPPAVERAIQRYRARTAADSAPPPSVSTPHHVAASAVHHATASAGLRTTASTAHGDSGPPAERRAGLAAQDQATPDDVAGGGGGVTPTPKVPMPMAAGVRVVGMVVQSVRVSERP